MQVYITTLRTFDIALPYEAIGLAPHSRFDAVFALQCTQRAGLERKATTTFRQSDVPGVRKSHILSKQDHVVNLRRASPGTATRV